MRSRIRPTQVCTLNHIFPALASSKVTRTARRYRRAHVFPRRPGIRHRRQFNQPPDTRPGSCTCAVDLAQGLTGALDANPLLEAYSASLHAHPLVTKCLTSASVFTASDIIAQTSFEQPVAPESGEQQGGVDIDIDTARVARFGLFGLVVHAPLFAWFFASLDAAVQPLDLPEQGAVATKVLIDQVLWTPPYLAFFFFVQCLLQGQDAGSGARKVKEILLPTLQVNWRVWVPANIVNYTLPADLRLLWINMVSLAFTVYLSLTLASTASEETADLSDDVADQ